MEHPRHTLLARLEVLVAQHRANSWCIKEPGTCSLEGEVREALTRFEYLWKEFVAEEKAREKKERKTCPTCGRKGAKT
jgi:hypothetical protein